MRHFRWDALDETNLPSVSGSVRRRFVSGQNLTIARISFAPGTELPAHRHENEQVSVVLDGAIEFVVEGETVRVQAGEAILLAPNELHGARTSPDQGVVLIDIFAPHRADWS